ncbi:MAG: hypothetical protein PGN07_06300 [Aeromicrobium erythreum]
MFTRTSMSGDRAASAASSACSSRIFALASAASMSTPMRLSPREAISARRSLSFCSASVLATPILASGSAARARADAGLGLAAELAAEALAGLLALLLRERLGRGEPLARALRDAGGNLVLEDLAEVLRELPHARLDLRAQVRDEAAGGRVDLDGG